MTLRPEEKAISHTTVYSEPGVFAGWPANHGAWQWGDEFLVGFMRGPYTRKARTHQIDEPFQKMLARSLDGGRSWSVETPNVDFDAEWTGDAPAFNLGDDTIIRLCGVYDHGGDTCDPGGGYYMSRDRGRVWSGAYGLEGLQETFSNGYECSARTAVLGDLVFLTRRVEGRFGTDTAFVATCREGVFEKLGDICNDRQRAAMPAVAAVGDRIVVALRRTNFLRYWIEAFGSDDGGRSWVSLGDVAETSRKNGNPPALIAVGDVLVCAYGERDGGKIEVCISRDRGRTWLPHGSIRVRGKSDIGYPVLFRRSDDTLVCVYYWAAGTGDQQRIEATEFRIDA